ncbi:phosphoadenosine phosphosulfate reductase family protein [Alicyclobacillus fodiniaquatilis]|uniref:Phosphoadenosine phosphosulfate reductase family protein n=1 Tax=Alicyclobacillus fodiniaquatilis TaxID=1661150 RepID=A0ABW4JJF3_9BACL
MGLLTALMQETHELQDIIEEIKEIYLRDNRDLIVTFSTGKDSSLVLSLVWTALEQLPVHQRTKTIHVITSETGVEEPAMTAFVRHSVRMIQQAAASQRLPIQAHLVMPVMKDRYWVQVLGKGNTPVMSTSRFMWCQSKLKIQPVNRIVEEICARNSLTTFDEYDAVMLLGVREDESSRRKTSIEKHALEDKFALHANLKRVLVYHPIRHITTSQVWDTLITHGLPWGVDIHDLVAHYQASDKECPFTANCTQAPSCGGGRNGCFVCTMMSHPMQDPMMVNLINSGNTSLIPLLAFKGLLYDIRLDIRYRQPLRRAAERNLLKQADTMVGQLNLFDDEAVDDFKMVEGWKFEPGPISLAGRKLLLEALLYTEQASGHTLIEEAEIDAILEAWAADGLILNKSSLQAVNHMSHYDGRIVLHKDTAQLNVKETTNRNPIFPLWELFDMGQDEVIQFLRERSIKTGVSIFYFMQPYNHGDLKATNVQFLLCGPILQTVRQAREYLDQWLGFATPDEMGVLTVC